MTFMHFFERSFSFDFWLHFLAINLFVGNWIVSDAKIYQISKLFVIISLVVTYFTGPIGLLVYWLFRIFYSKINFMTKFIDFYFDFSSPYLYGYKELKK